MGNGRRVLYHPDVVRRFVNTVMRYAKEIEMIREDLRLERDQIREQRHLLRAEMDAAWAELRRLQAIDAACRSERDFDRPLH